MYFEVYKDKAGEWRWRLVSPFGDEQKIIADSAEGYINQQDCLTMVHRVATGSKYARTKIVE